MDHGQTSKPVYKVEQPKNRASPPQVLTSKAKDAPQGKQDQLLPKESCGRCRKKDNTGKNCPHIIRISAITVRRKHICNQFACQKVNGTLESDGLQQLDTTKIVRRSIPPLYQQVKLWRQGANSEIDSEANDALRSEEMWIEIGKSKLKPVEAQYKDADGSPLQVFG